MNSYVVFIGLIIFLIGCTNQPVTDISHLIPDEQELNSIKLSAEGCQTESYETHERAPLKQYSICNFTGQETNITTQIYKYTNFDDLNGSYQYKSLHLRGYQGLIEENSYGQLSRFYVNNESTTYYYHFWIVEDPFLVHVTSKGSAQAKGYVEALGLKMLEKI